MCGGNPSGSGDVSAGAEDIADTGYRVDQPIVGPRPELADLVDQPVSCRETEVRSGEAVGAPLGQQIEPRAIRFAEAAGETNGEPVLIFDEEETHDDSIVGPRQGGAGEVWICTRRP